MSHWLTLAYVVRSRSSGYGVDIVLIFVERGPPTRNKAGRAASRPFYAASGGQGVKQVAPRSQAGFQPTAAGLGILGPMALCDLNARARLSRKSWPESSRSKWLRVAETGSNGDSKQMSVSANSCPRNQSQKRRSTKSAVFVVEPAGRGQAAARIAAIFAA